jgi:hypothetical protein
VRRETAGQRRAHRSRTAQNLQCFAVGQKGGGRGATPGWSLSRCRLQRRCARPR